MNDRLDQLWLNLCSFVFIPLGLLGLFVIAMSPCVLLGYIAWLIWGGG